MFERVFFVQTRIGQGERPFRLWKLQTISTHTGKVSRIGALLRRWRIDEIPQLYNVVRGDMTFFGPRPLVPEEHFSLPDDVRAARRALKPGWLAPSHVLLGHFTREDFVRAERDYFRDIKEHGRVRAMLRCISVIVRNVVSHGARGRTPTHLLQHSGGPMEPSLKLSPTIINRLNSRSFAMVLAGALFTAGVYLIITGVSGGGTIDMQAAVVRGKLQSGSVGLFCVFAGLLITLSCVIVRPRSTIKVSRGPFKFEYSGYISIERIHRLQSLIKELSESLATVPEVKTTAIKRGSTPTSSVQLGGTDEVTANQSPIKSGAA